MSKEKIPATVRNAVWIKYIGELHNAKCFCCNIEPITKGNFNCGHIISEKNGGKVHLDNLRPICCLCNSSMGVMNMFEFMEKYGFVNSDNQILVKQNDENKKSIVDNSELSRYLSRFTVLELRQIYRENNISKIKPKLIQKIIKKRLTKDIIEKSIIENEMNIFFVRCLGSWHEEDNLGLNKNAHNFYTNNIPEHDDYKSLEELDNYNKISVDIYCELCKKLCTSFIYINSLYNDKYT